MVNIKLYHLSPEKWAQGRKAIFILTKGFFLNPPIRWLFNTTKANLSHPKNHR